MGSILDRVEGPKPGPSVRCPYCAEANDNAYHCRHVRWTFDQGDPLDFARFAMETSPYVRARGRKVSEISSYWWDEHGESIVDQVVTLFGCGDGFVFGDIALLDVLTRDIWKRFDPDPVPATQLRYDP